MDYESWIQGYLTGVSLHRHLRIPQLFPNVLAEMSVTGIAADFDWHADLFGVTAITLLTATSVGNVSASYSYDGKQYADFVPLSELLKMNPGELFRGLDGAKPSLYFRFHLANDAADLTSFAVKGFSQRSANGREAIIPEGRSAIADHEFANSDIASVKIPEGVTSIGEGAFQECRNLTSATIPSTATSIGDSAFQNCSALTTVTIPASVTEIGANAFNGCDNLRDIYYAGTPSQWANVRAGVGNGPLIRATVHFGAADAPHGSSLFADSEDYISIDYGDGIAYLPLVWEFSHIGVDYDESAPGSASLETDENGLLFVDYEGGARNVVKGVWIIAVSGDGYVVANYDENTLGNGAFGVDAEGYAATNYAAFPIDAEGYVTADYAAFGVDESGYIIAKRGENAPGGIAFGVDAEGYATADYDENASGGISFFTAMGYASVNYG